MSVTVGMKIRVEEVVTEQNTAICAGSGTLPVFATPFMCALMEKAAWMAIAPALNEGDSSVGTKLNISHVSATPVGLKVWAESEVTAVDGKVITSPRFSMVVSERVVKSDDIVLTDEDRTAMDAILAEWASLRATITALIEQAGG